MEKDFSKSYKPNTKEFWQNVWFYYRIHIIVGIIVLILIGYTVNEMVSRKDPDFAFMYLGSQTLNNEEKTEQFFEKYVTDVNGDGTVYPNVLNLAFGDGSDPQYVSAIMQKAELTLVADNTPMIMLIDEDNIKHYIEIEAFAPIDKLVKKHGISEDNILYNGNNKAVCVNVTGTKFAEKIGYFGDKKVYLGLQFKRENKKNNKDYLKLYAESERMFEFILGGKF